MKKETKLDAIEIGRGLAGAILITILMWTGIVTAIYPGETKVYPNDMGIDNLVYTIVGNSSPTNIGITINSTNITVYLPSNSPPDNFKVIFLEKETETIVQTIYTGGGGGGTTTIYKDRNIPIYTDVIKENEVLVDVPVEKIVEVETGLKWWHLLIAPIILVILYFIFREKK